MKMRIGVFVLVAAVVGVLALVLGWSYAPADPADVILGRPTASSVAMSVLCARDTNGAIVYGTDAASLSGRTATLSFKAAEPQIVPISGLQADTQYYYRLTDSVGTTLVQGAFHTQRAAGSAFSFTITADPHLDNNTDIDLYAQTLANVAGDSPDFHIDLGDTFMTDKQQGNLAVAAQKYLDQRSLFGTMSKSVPLYLVLGNHDGEAGKLLKGGASSLAVWSNAVRKRYFLNPAPDSFYSGNTTADTNAGVLQDYYAWQWGDALFVALDPYWYSANGGSDDRWSLTLGKTQYDWLKSTLESSPAKYKFVFVHQLTGGVTSTDPQIDKAGRGGIDGVPFGEWGGHNDDGTEGFASKRPGWGVPIHDLLVSNGVTAVFHGHDHLFAKEELDGIVYQEVPQPGLPRTGAPNNAAAYGYTSGVILGGAGHMRVTVSPGGVTADYIQAHLAKDATSAHPNAETAYSYTIGTPTKTAPTVGTPKAPTTMSHSRASTIYGYLNPRHIAGAYPVRIYKYRLVSGKWKSYGYVKAKASNYSSYTKYSASVRLPYAGKWRVRANAPADTSHTAAWSSGYDYVTVK